MAGATAYELYYPPLRVIGYVLDTQTETEIAPSVRAILKDDTGLIEAREALADIVWTEFDAGLLESILAPRLTYEEWRVGEALAQVHLKTVEDCNFPWPDSRSLRNPTSSSGGVDLIGVHVGKRTRFVFAEVKTSHQQAWPPSVVTSRSHGLHSQLAGLMVGDDRLGAAIRYLVMNGLGRPWFGAVKEAVATYLADQADVVLFGVLVHASDAKSADLNNLAQNLMKAHTKPTSSALVALYTSPESLVTIAGAEIELETAE